MKLVSVLCTFSLPAGLVFAEIAEAKMAHHRRHVSGLYHRYRNEERLRRASPRAGDIQRYRQDRSRSECDNSCFSLPYLPEQYSCSPKGGDGF